MTVREAERIRDEFDGKTNPGEDEIFAFTEAMNFLIETVGSPEDMRYLGGVYYERKKFDLALTQAGEKTGYVPEMDNVVFSRLMDAGKRLSAQVLQITQRESYAQIRIAISLVDF